MKWILSLLIVIGVKTVLGKGLMSGLILLSFFLKGKSIKNSPVKWNDYLLTLDDVFITKYVIALYCISTVLSSCAAYVLFNILGFQNPLFKTILLAAVCVALFIIKYMKKGKKEVIAGLNKIHKSALEENSENA